MAAAGLYLSEYQLRATHRKHWVILATSRGNQSEPGDDGHFPLHASRTRAVSLGIHIAIACALRSASLPPSAAPRTLTVACVARSESTTTPFAPTLAAWFRTDLSRSPLPVYTEFPS